MLRGCGAFIGRRRLRLCGRGCSSLSYSVSELTHSATLAAGMDLVSFTLACLILITDPTWRCPYLAVERQGRLMLHEPSTTLTVCPPSSKTCGCCRFRCVVLPVEGFQVGCLGKLYQTYLTKWTNMEFVVCPDVLLPMWGAIAIGFSGNQM